LRAVCILSDAVRRLEDIVLVLADNLFGMPR
jgi:hypothetical protein